MKTTNAATLLGYCALFLTFVAHASPQSPDPASLSITTSSNVTVVVNDPANHVWVVQQSSDFVEWSEMVHGNSITEAFTAICQRQVHSDISEPIMIQSATMS